MATAPEDDARTRSRKYFLMMSLRVVCFILMVTVTPYGWYTWLFALGAVVLPYLAVVVANVSAGTTARKAEPPMRPLAASAPPAPAPTVTDDGIIRLQETPRRDDAAHPTPPPRSRADDGLPEDPTSEDR
ncbi:DUF3099 domain-containing protein [Microbacterium sp. 179-B 1A2 NHS]|uniref:DUF3099 domain-containing protein n=1 Tax=Microbacterium sp. 179-B 1A2 NHS TaxID=3142383 RepID=UPI0039A30210